MQRITRCFWDSAASMALIAIIVAFGIHYQALVQENQELRAVLRMQMESVPESVPFPKSDRTISAALEREAPSGILPELWVPHVELEMSFRKR